MAGFDVAVIGAGAAGCVLAARLSESPSRSVVLLEAGPDLGTSPPDELRDGWHLSREFDWGYRSEPDEWGEVADLRRAKLIGGTSWLTRFALRGSPADYDEWQGLGNDGWGFADVLPYLRRLEADADFGDQDWHGEAGPIPVNRYLSFLERTEVHAAALVAAEAAGFPRIEDHNRPWAVGVGPMPMNSVDGIRVTTADAYLGEGRTRPNLTIRPDAQVAHVILESSGATGVQLIDGTTIEAGCVVLCAGTFGNPPILMRSGIGPAEHLRSLEIPVQIDLPGVGANLADHPGTDIDCGYRGTARDTPLLHSVATFHSSGASGSEPPDLMLWMSDPAPPDNPSMFIDVVLLKPHSRGAVRLRSTDPSDPPLIVLPGLRQWSDVERLAEGYQRAHEVASDSALRRLCADPLPPTPQDHDELLLTIRATAFSVPHVVGTCAMGTSPESGAVVDAEGRVHGIDSLSVADASIMPTVPSGFTHIPTIMIAERLSEVIAQTC